MLIHADLATAHQHRQEAVDQRRICSCFRVSPSFCQSIRASILTRHPQRPWGIHRSTLLLRHRPRRPILATPRLRATVHADHLHPNARIWHLHHRRQLPLSLGTVHDTTPRADHQQSAKPSQLGLNGQVGLTSQLICGRSQTDFLQSTQTLIGWVEPRH